MTLTPTPTPKPTPPAYRLSPQQQAVLDWATNASGSLNLIARAGCGKTSTLKALVRHLAAEGLIRRGPGWGGVFLGAFNKPIAEELKTWLIDEQITFDVATAGTMHSLGFRMWSREAQNVRVDGKKLDRLFDQRANGRVAFEPYRHFVIKAVGFAKQRALETPAPEDFDQIADHFGLLDDLDETLNLDLAYGMCETLYRTSLDECRRAVDYDDMILAPLIFRPRRAWKYDWVLIDEAQDTNPARRALALSVLRPGGRLVAVGDPAQAIYGFTGADGDAMNLLRDQLDSAELPLNVTYRCPKRVVEQAQAIVPDIVAHQDAPEGETATISTLELLDLAAAGRAPLSHGDAILCRKTAPLASLAYALLRRGVGCMMEGRDVGQGLLRLAARFNVKTLEALLRKVDEWRERETAKWTAKERPDKVASVADVAEMLVVIAESLQLAGKTSVADLKTHVEAMFGDTQSKDAPKVVTLATVHRSKGREWDRVFLLGRSAFMPSRWARKAWEIEQEQNLIYVALTRARRELIDVQVDEGRVK